MNQRLAMERLILWTLCVTLTIATVGILALMALGHNVAKEVSLAIAAQWGALLVVAREKGK